MSVHPEPTSTPAPAPAAPVTSRRSAERTAWWAVLTVLALAAVVMLGAWN